MTDILHNFIDTFGKTKPEVIAIQKGVNSSNNYKAYIKEKVKAIERMETETNPKIKRRMQLLINEGIYDFSGIENW